MVTVPCRSANQAELFRNHGGSKAVSGPPYEHLTRSVLQPGQANFPETALVRERQPDLHIVPLPDCRAAKRLHMNIIAHCNRKLQRLRIRRQPNLADRSSGPFQTRCDIAGSLRKKLCTCPTRSSRKSGLRSGLSAAGIATAARTVRLSSPFHGVPETAYRRRITAGSCPAARKVRPVTATQFQRRFLPLPAGSGAKFPPETPARPER